MMTCNCCEQERLWTEKLKNADFTICYQCYHACNVEGCMVTNKVNKAHLSITPIARALMDGRN